MEPAIDTGGRSMKSPGGSKVEKKFHLWKLLFTAWPIGRVNPPSIYHPTLKGGELIHGEFEERVSRMIPKNRAFSIKKAIKTILYGFFNFYNR